MIHNLSHISESLRTFENIEYQSQMGCRQSAVSVSLSPQDDGALKLLVLGVGAPGKSTLFKQMKMMYGNEFTEAERQYSHFPYGNRSYEDLD